MTNNDSQNISDEEFVEILKYDSDILDKPEAHYYLGLRYLTGEGVPQDLQKGFLKIKKAAEMKYTEAYRDLGICYFAGEGTEKDINAAARWWAEAAANGDLNAMNNLGTYYTAQDNKKLNEKGIRLLKAAAEQGQAEAQCNLGLAYWQGKLIDKNEKEALKWLEKAAEQNLPNALFGLGLYYKKKLDEQKEAGENFMENGNKAVDYIYAAAEAGFEPAIEFLQEACKQLENYLKSETYKKDQ